MVHGARHAGSTEQEPRSGGSATHLSRKSASRSREPELGPGRGGGATHLRRESELRPRSSGGTGHLRTDRRRRGASAEWREELLELPGCVGYSVSIIVRVFRLNRRTKVKTNIKLFLKN